MNVRPALESDLPEILRTYAYARAFMKRTGNPNQWGDTHPAEALVRGDIPAGRSFVAEQDGEICGVFAYIRGEDPTYRVITGGEWLNDAPYGTIHRIAGNGKRPGVLTAAVDFALSRCPNLRIDTHRDNAVMHHLLAKLGFTRCGIIYLENGDPRVAYQLVRSCRSAEPHLIR